MKLQFTVKPYQTEAVNAVADVFAGQPGSAGLSYRIDPGTVPDGQQLLTESDGLRNADIRLTDEQLLANIRSVRAERNISPADASLVRSAAAPHAPNLDIEMETGTGKTYVYIKTMMELNRRYGWSKFVVVVPSIAIREGVKKTFDITADHFQAEYGTKPRAFVYNSSQLHEIERFSADSGVQVMIINIQAFNATGKDNRRIYEVLDDFQSRRPIDVIAANKPIVIIDEPQKIGAKKSLESLARFDALMLLRYSATHVVQHTLVHRLDAVDAYNAKLVKKIAVRGIEVKGLAGSTAYLYLDGIELKKGAKPRARIELEVQTATGIKRLPKTVDAGTNLHDLSSGIEAYKGLFVRDVDATRDVLELSNGDEIIAGRLDERDATEETKRRIQIREVIRAHLDKERSLFAQGIKVLSLFFIDEVAKYRDYGREDTLGDYARTFEEEYGTARQAILNELSLNDDDRAYRDYLLRDEVRAVHQGYFSIDKKGRQVDPAVVKTGDEKGQSKDADAYDLILRDKERLLSLTEPVRFIFSHSALREGWDNPNVFVMGMLKKSNNTVSRRQEIGRGLRLAVNQDGVRIDDPAIVHDVNELTVVTDESYTDFVNGLQKEIADTLTARPRKATEAYFEGKTFTGPDGQLSTIEAALARDIYKYLLKHDYIDDDDHVTDIFKDALAAGTLAAPTSERLGPVIDFVIPLVQALYLELPVPVDARRTKTNPLNEANFDRKEFQALWKRINHKAVYQVDFDTDELIRHAVAHLDEHLRVTPTQYVLTAGQQRATLGADAFADGDAFARATTSTVATELSEGSTVKYDLLGEITEKTQLTRRTACAILQGVRPDTFAKFKQNPEEFITEAARLINEKKATAIVEHLRYDVLDDRYDSAIFTQNQTGQLLGDPVTKHIYDYAVVDSAIERAFVGDLETSSEVAVYAKLPRGFVIPTPVGDYNPDWAIAFTEGTVKHVYFVAETKGSLQSLQLRGVEEAKIACAKKFFASLADRSPDAVKYDVVTSYADLMSLVSAGEVH